MPTPTDPQGQPTSSLPQLQDVELLKRYRMRVEAAKQWRQAEHYDDTWKRLRDLYRLRVFSDDSEEDRLLVAIAFATINVIEPSIAINYPKLTVTAASEQHADQAIIAEAVLNYEWRHHDIQHQFRRAAKDYLVYGHGWLKVGYRYTEAEVPLNPDEIGQNAQDLFDQVDQAASDPSMARHLPTDQQVVDNLPTTKTVTVEDESFVERVSPFDVFVDPEATDMSDARWLAQRVARPLEEAQSDPRYDVRARRKLQSDGSTAWHLDNSANNVQAEKDRVTLWEFYDLQRKTMCVFANSGDGFLVQPQDMPYKYGLPFVMLRDYDVPDQFYPIGELEAIEPLQLEINETRSAMIRARKGSLRKYFYRKDSFSDASIQALRSDRDNTMVPVEDQTPFNDVMAPVPAISTQSELYHHSETILADFDRVSGVSEYQRGELPEIRRTATEANIIQDAINARAADKLGRIEKGVAEVGRRLLQLAQQYMDKEKAARITGSQGQTMWFTYSASDIEGEFDFSVEAGSMRPINETGRRQEALQMLQTFIPLMSAGIVNPYALAEHVLRNGFGIASPEKFLMQPQEPGQGQQDQKPFEKLIESINYKDAPPDIQRQMEQQAGFQPSGVGGSSPAEAQVNDHALAVHQTDQKHQHDAAKAIAQMRSQIGLHALKAQADQQRAQATAAPTP